MNRFLVRVLCNSHRAASLSVMLLLGAASVKADLVRAPELVNSCNGPTIEITGFQLSPWRTGVDDP
jgi:hypothetical protein